MSFQNLFTMWCVDNSVLGNVAVEAKNVEMDI